MTRFCWRSGRNPQPRKVLWMHSVMVCIVRIQWSHALHHLWYLLHVPTIGFNQDYNRFLPVCNVMLPLFAWPVYMYMYRYVSICPTDLVQESAVAIALPFYSILFLCSHCQMHSFCDFCYYCTAPVLWCTHQHPITPYFYRPDALPAAQPTASKHWMT